MKLLGISGTIIGSKTVKVVEKALEEAKRLHPDIEVELLDLKQYNIEFCDGRKPSDYNEDTQKAIKLISSADAYIIGSPIFHGTFPGTLKNLLDLNAPEVFRRKVMGFIATGGNDQHYLALENQLKPIASYFKAYAATEYVFAHNKDFNKNNEIISPELLENIRNLADEVCKLHQSVQSLK